MHKIVIFLFLIAAGLGYALFSFYGAYSVCYEAHTQVRYTYSELTEHSEELASLSVKTGAFALKYLPNGRTIVSQMETSARQIRCPESVNDLAISCGRLYSSMKKVIVLLNDDIKAKNDHRFQDTSLQINKISRDIVLTGRKYNHAAKRYNKTLQEPMPRFWSFMFDTEPAQIFKAKKKKS